ncbi:MAG: proline racemase family protein [Acidobacteriota bacterium]
MDLEGLRIQTIEAHTAGEPLRIIVSGWPEILGASILDKRRHARRHHDALRRLLMLEPRGHADMYGCIPTPPTTEDGDLGVLFLHNAGFSTMCGHGIIGLVTVGLEHGLFKPEDTNDIRIDTPAGRVVARAERQGNRIVRVAFRNVPSFLLEETSVSVPGIGDVALRLAFGGAFYAYVDAEPLGVPLDASGYAQLVDHGRRIKRTVEDEIEIAHPEGDEDLGFLYGVIFVGSGRSGGHHRNVCVFADGEVDRSPTGTGVSGLIAIHHAQGAVRLGESRRIESILGTSFEVSALEETTVGSVPAVVPEVIGSASVTGRAEFWLDPNDALPEGFLLR